MLAKLSADMLNDQVNCYTIISPTRYDYVSILFGWKNKIIEGRLNKFRILKNYDISVSATEFHVSVDSQEIVLYKAKTKCLFR